ncbi:MAG: hemolysin family protein [Bifidobacteriaceae bacterium]|jgi:CBS domain containing-hemolysin-like protein|nr:hemolysin family protein [Bifidobacteriaceae bacterium]
MSPWWSLLLAALLVAANAFFVGAEFSVMSVRRAQMEPLAEAGSRRARTVFHALERVSDMLAAAQLGVTVASTSLGAVAEPAIAHLVMPAARAAGFGTAAAHTLAALLALIIVVYVHVVLGEMVPKNLAMASPERAALAFTPPLAVIARVLHPVIRALNWVASLGVRALGLKPADAVAAAFTAPEVASIVARSSAEGVLADPEGLLAGSIEFSDLTAGQLAVPLDQLVTLPLDVTPADVERAVAETGYSRFPVRDPAGSLTGYVHVMDVLYAEGAERDRPIRPAQLRELRTVGAAEEVEDVLALMQRSRCHMAQVAGPSGGVIFLEDIIEELVGEIREDRGGLGGGTGRVPPSPAPTPAV